MARRKTAKNFISAYKLEQMFRQLERNPENDKLFQSLILSYNEMAKIANSRIRRIDKADLGYYSSYNRARNILDVFGLKLFPKMNKSKADENYEEFKALVRGARKFVISRVATVGEIKRYEKNTVKFWSDLFYDIKDSSGKKLSQKKISDAILELSRNGLLQPSKMFYDSKTMVEAIDFLARKKGNIQEIKSRIKQVQKGERRYAEIFN